MASINYAFKEISCKIVYYGPGLSGKTTNLQYVHQNIPSQTRGDLISLATDQDRTLFFDFLPLDIGKIHGFSTKFQLYTVPGQVYYNATRKLVLRGVDGLVFVADSQKSKMDENIESWQNLAENLTEYGYDINKIPLVFQYNKRDLPEINSVEELEGALNLRGVPHFEASATKGIGVFDALKCISKLVLDQAKHKKLFSERKMMEKEDKKKPAEYDFPPMKQTEQTAAASSSIRVDILSPQPVAVITPKESELKEEERLLQTPDISKETNPKIELEVGEINQKEERRMTPAPSKESPTIISWSAGRSGKRAKDRGFFLWRMLSKLFNRYSGGAN
jgi:signal recognition particle receptor subunit beta